MSDLIRIFGARQNNLKNINVDFQLGSFTVITGVSGSGKSSLAFDTLYAEGQRKYVETFSPYARQFLDRLDKPQVDKIEGVLPAIAIEQTNSIRNSRSSVGTMSELNDYLKVLYAKAGQLYCRQCASPVKRDNPEQIYADICQHFAPNQRVIISFTIHVPHNFTVEEIIQQLHHQGYERILGVDKNQPKHPIIYVTQDRLKINSENKSRIIEALETCFNYGAGQCVVLPYLPDLPDEDFDQLLAQAHKFSDQFHCASCNITYDKPQANSFSFNSPLGACESCKGFGRTMGIDYGLVIPNPKLSLREGAIKPWQTPSYKEQQEDLIRFAQLNNIDIDTPFKDLDEAIKTWVIQGDPQWKGGRKAWQNQWYGVVRFFDWLESKNYKMHIRVLLSKYRSYTTCASCHGSRLKPSSNLWRLGLNHYDKPAQRYIASANWSASTANTLPGLSLFDVMSLPLKDVREFFNQIHLDHGLTDALKLILQEINTRINFLCDVGLGYLNLNRQSRTLSGGELQRINLTTALGTSLTNTLFVLDEPSIGLHPMDINKINQLLRQLVQAGNTLVVVEHDPQIMLCADRILDMGPGPGKNGGQIIFDGTPAQLLQAPTLTGQYLRQQNLFTHWQRPVKPNCPKLLLLGVSEHNLKNVDFSLALNHFVCLTGVSGSGKSTLMQDVLYPAILKSMGKSTETPGKFTSILGVEQITDVVLIDQTSIGKTSRSNPVIYVGAFDAIRKVFIQTTLAKERGYTAGTFSFNSGTGRCPACSGSGFEHIEMQFLSDVYIRCHECNGRRYRDEILEVKIHHLGRSASIDQVLEMTVSEALEFFKGMREIQAKLKPLVDVGLDYLTLGQPVPTLSGGESQRLKLAGHLAQVNQTSQTKKKTLQQNILFLFDEPTTGLHFDDIAKLIKSMRQLQQAGHSLLVIEHNLDVIAQADEVIDFGPYGGDEGGTIVAQGSPQQIQNCAQSLTGQALRQYTQQQDKQDDELSLQEKQINYTNQTTKTNKIQHIQIINAKEHNLKNISVNIPQNTFSVITGVSGSGKSTLAFDILFNEGQRRYLESLNAYARAVVQPNAKPDVEAIYGISPTVAIEQRTSRGGVKSTVATMTEIYHFLRLIYVKLGTQYCPSCKLELNPQSTQEIHATIMHKYMGQRVGVLATLINKRKGYYTDLAQWASKKGFTHLRVNGNFVSVNAWPRLERYKEHTIELPVYDCLINHANQEQLLEALNQAVDYGNGNISIIAPISPDNIYAGDYEQDFFSTKRVCHSCGNNYPEPDPRLFSYNSKMGWCHTCFGAGMVWDNQNEEDAQNDFQNIAPEDSHVCPSCHGSRLNHVANAVLWHGLPITQITQWSIKQAQEFFANLSLTQREALIATDIVREIQNRLGFMIEVGLAYLNLNRSAPTLSGGEAQRIRLAAQLGSNLQGVCYVLDEPTIGLHPRDNRMLLNSLEKLERNGNTLVVVEHDEETIRRAKHIIDIGPGAGIRGGEVVAQGNLEQIMQNPQSQTGQYLKQPLQHPSQPRRPIDNLSPDLTIHGANLHNLKNIDVRLPFQRLNVITGVSGSGKSTLARHILLKNLQQQLNSNVAIKWHGCANISNWQKIDRVLEVDQSPIGKTSRSCPATYIGFMDDIRQLFANTQAAKMRGWGADRFSFNTGKGRCPICEGQGMRTLEMNFLPNVKVQCESCEGMRFNHETLRVKVREHSIGQVLNMEVSTAIEFFANHPKILRSLQLMQDVGLGYLTLGHCSNYLSGGEAQRIKLVSELIKSPTKGRVKSGQAHAVYILDEPTVGLAMTDVAKLIKILHRLVEQNHTVIVIEHNLDIIAEADWIVDLGPEGGDDNSGQVVAMGTPETIVLNPASHTGTYLAEVLRP